MVLAASLLLVVVGAAVVAVQFEHAGATRAVLVASRPLQADTVLEPSDLRSVRVHVPPGVAVVSAAAEATVVGRPVAGPVPLGAVLAPGDLAAGPNLYPGSALVGVAVGAGQLPADGVRPGNVVDVVATTAANGQGTGGVGAAPGTVVVADATVVAVGVPASSGSSTSAVVSVVVPVLDAPTVAELSAAGAAALVVVAAP